MTVRWIKFTFLCFSMLSRVILEEFGTVNSPLCTAAPPKAKKKHKACNFQDRLGQKPLELCRISSASKCRSPPSFGDNKSRLTCKSQAKNLCNWPPLTTSKAYSISDIRSPSCWIYETFLGITCVDIRSSSCRIYEIVSSDSEKWYFLGSLASCRDRLLQITNNVRVQLAYQITDVTRPQSHWVVCLW